MASSLKTVSLSRLLKTLAAFFLLALIVNLSFTLMPVIRGLVDARTNRVAVARFEAIFHAANRIAAERGPANTIMSIEAGSDAEAVKRLASFRRQSDAALEAMARSADPHHKEWPRGVREIRAVLATARERVDQLAARPAGERTLGMTIEAGNAMMAVADLFQPIVRHQKFELLRSDGRLVGALDLADAASDLRDFAGRLGTYIIPFIAKGEAISADRLRLVEEGRGRILQLMSFMPREVTKASRTDFSQALHDAEMLYLNKGLTLIDRLTADGRRGGAYSLSAEDLTAQYVPTMAPLESLRTIVIADMVDRFMVAEADAHSELRWVSAIAAATTVVILVLLLTIRKLTVDPLLAARREVIALSQDEFGMTHGPVRHVGELTSLFAALALLRERLVQRHSLIEALRVRTEVDTLTGLMSRTHFERCVEDAIDTSKGSDVGIIYLDIDHFKTVNDTLGHQVGDALLAEVGRLLRGFASQAVLIGRIGGDEFAICCTSASAQEREALALDLIAAIDGIRCIDGHAVSLSASIGLSVGQPGPGLYRELCRQADVALYQSKSEGRKRATWYEPDQAGPVPQSLLAKTELDAALDKGEFSLVFQPIVSLAANKVVSREALARWTRPSIGLIAPGIFIPALETSGMIGVFGEWVLQSAVREAAEWSDHAAVSVNVSPYQLDNPTFPLKVARIIADAGLSPDRLHLEITESIDIGSHGHRAACLHQLRLLGIKIALDDVGTGYAGLSTIQSIPLDFLKIDRRFISAIDRCERSETILANLLSLARDLGLETVAEGVETQRQLDWLTSHNCDRAQGYLLGKPVASHRGDVGGTSTLIDRKGSLDAGPGDKTQSLQIAC